MRPLCRTDRFVGQPLAAFMPGRCQLRVLPMRVRRIRPSNHPEDGCTPRKQPFDLIKNCDAPLRKAIQRERWTGRRLFGILQLLSKPRTAKEIILATKPYASD